MAEVKRIREALLELYLDVKVRSNDEVSLHILNGEQLTDLDEGRLTEEKRKLGEVDCVLLIEYIRTSIEILLNLKMEDEEGGSRVSNYFSGRSIHTNDKIDHSKCKAGTVTPNADEGSNTLTPADKQEESISSILSKKAPAKAYEEQIQRYESDIRMHISVTLLLFISLDRTTVEDLH